MSWKLKILLKSPIGCKVTAFSLLGICIAAVIFNLYHALGGECSSFDELLSCFTKDDLVILIMGIGFFVFFMWASGNAKRKQEKEKQQTKASNAPAAAENDESVKGYEEDYISEKQKCTLNYLDEQVTFYIPANCSLVEIDSHEEIEESGLVFASCNTAEGDFINVCLCPAKDEYEGGARAYIEDEFSELSPKVQEKAKVEQMLISGRICYYFVVCYRENGNKWQQVYMACDVGANNIFAVELDSVDNKRELSIMDIQDMFHFV